MLVICVLQISPISVIKRCWVGRGAVHKLLRAHEPGSAPCLRLWLLLCARTTVACEGVLVGCGVGTLALVGVRRPVGGREHAGLALRGRVGRRGVPGIRTGSTAGTAAESVLTLVVIYLLFYLLSLLLGHSTKFNRCKGRMTLEVIHFSKKLNIRPCVKYQHLLFKESEEINPSRYFLHVLFGILIENVFV